MMGKKETVGNGVAWRSAAFRWAVFSSAAMFPMLRTAATMVLHHSNTDCNSTVAMMRAIMMATITLRTTSRATANHPLPPPRGTPTSLAPGSMMAPSAEAATTACCGNVEHDINVAMVTVSAIFRDRQEMSRLGNDSSLEMI